MGDPSSEPLSKATGWPCTLPAFGLTGAELGIEPGAEPGPSEPLSKFSGCPYSRSQCHTTSSLKRFLEAWSQALGQALEGCADRIYFSSRPCGAGALLHRRQVQPTMF